ncbi:YqaJ viral recombinase family protein [Luethyella okanaganae]|uniref:YqaJ viral recombinase family protein n=1 Tax=Luethyella okanaganae TaxID=69372 RepID=A0ABW1VBE5_9MICO
MPQPFDPEKSCGEAFGAACLQRIVADSSDRVAWLRARSRGITATDVAKLATQRSIQNAALDKLHGSGFGGNVWTDHGRSREPVIAAWVQAIHGIAPSTSLFHAEGQPLHLATPDGFAVRASGAVELAEIKTTSKPWRSIPRAYLRQVWWQQYVLGAERTLVVWEQHDNFVPTHDEPLSRWVDRDDEQIAVLVGLAGQLVEVLRRQVARDAASREARELYGPGALYV